MRALTEPATEAAGEATTAAAGYQWTTQPSVGSTGTSQMYDIILYLHAITPPYMLLSFRLTWIYNAEFLLLHRVLMYLN